MHSVAEITTALNGRTPDELRTINRAVVAALKAALQQEATNIALSLKKGDRVELHNIRPAHYDGRKGEVVGFGRSKVIVKLDGEKYEHNIAATCLRKIDEPAPAAAVNRAESEIIGDIARTYSALSPEDFTSDGEAPASQVARKTKELKAKLGSLFGELGRYVDERDALELDAKNAA